MLTRSIAILCLIGSFLLPLRADGQTPDPQLTLKPAIESFRRAKSMTFDVRHETPANGQRKQRIARGHVTLLPSPKGGDADQMKITKSTEVVEAEATIRQSRTPDTLWTGWVLLALRNTLGG